MRPPVPFLGSSFNNPCSLSLPGSSVSHPEGIREPRHFGSHGAVVPPLTTGALICGNKVEIGGGTTGQKQVAAPVARHEVRTPLLCDRFGTQRKDKSGPRADRVPTECGVVRGRGGGAGQPRAEAEDGSDHPCTGFFCRVVSISSSQRGALATAHDAASPCPQGARCTGRKNPHWTRHRIAVLSGSAYDPVKVSSPAPECCGLRFALKQEAEMCFSNANFRNIYLNESLGNHNRFQIPINLGVFECLSSGGVSCLGLGDTSQSQQVACLMQRGGFSSRLNGKVDCKKKNSHPCFCKELGC